MRARPAHVRAGPPPRRSGPRLRRAAARPPPQPKKQAKIDVHMTPAQRGIKDPRPAVLVDKLAN
eukprot:4379838-Alexandrium_andersonii.AAC.1